MLGCLRSDEEGPDRDQATIHFVGGHRQSFQPRNTWRRTGMQALAQYDANGFPYSSTHKLRRLHFELGQEPRGAVG